MSGVSTVGPASFGLGKFCAYQLTKVCGLWAKKAVKLLREFRPQFEIPFRKHSRLIHFSHSPCLNNLEFIVLLSVLCLLHKSSINLERFIIGNYLIFHFETFHPYPSSASGKVEVKINFVFCKSFRLTGLEDFCFWVFSIDFVNCWNRLR